MNKLPTALFIVVLFYTSGLFIAPLTLEPGTVGPLSGGANQLTFADKWRELPVYHRIIYTFSDFNCHQMHERSYFINENQMPVCARCVGVFLGMSVGLFAMIFVEPKADHKDILLKFVPGDHSHRTSTVKLFILIGAAGLILLPILLDGGLQMVSSHESSNPLRLLTGTSFGFGLSLFLMALLMSSMEDMGENNIYRTPPASETEDLQWQNGKVSQEGKPPAEEKDSIERRKSSKLDRILVPL
ncbi:MAG: DUF2085 domain-containing protein [Thermoplasmata archaeon]